MNKNYYQNLGLNPNCSKEEIKKAYKSYAIKFHPDKHNNDPFFEERFKEIKEAYDILMNDIERNKYHSTYNQSDFYKKHSYQSKNSNNSYDSKNDEFYKRQKEKEKLEKEQKEKIEKKRKTLYFADKNITINGLTLFANNLLYKIDEIDYTIIKKEKSQQSKVYAPILIVVGILTFALIIGVFFLIAGIAGLFHKEYILIIHYKENHIPIIAGKKKYIEKIVLKLNCALKNK